MGPAEHPQSTRVKSQPPRSQQASWRTARVTALQAYKPTGISSQCIWAGDTTPMTSPHPPPAAEQQH